MAMVLAAALVLASFAASLEIVQAVRRRATPLALPVALSALVFFETLALPVLSTVGWVTPGGVLAVHLPLLVLGAFAWRKRRAAGRHHRWPRLPRWILLPILPIAVLVAASAVEYPPNTWDAMTYHLARVAHWITDRSVLSYPTWSPRQNESPPGAAFLLLVLQVVSGSDRLASLLQLACWTILVLVAPWWARLMGTPRRVAPFAALVVATLPMAVLQASSTQYDLVSSIVALAVVVLSVSAARRKRPSMRELALLGVALAAAWLVKATAVVVAVPFVAWAVAVRLWRDRALGSARMGASAAALLGPVAVAFAVECLRQGQLAVLLGGHSEGYAYGLSGEWLDRLGNSARGLAHHLPIAALLSRLSPALAPASGEGVGLGPELFRPHEDYVGNPLQAALFLAACLALLVRRGRVSRRTIVGVACTVAGWVVLHALGRDNGWISRLETPSFVLAVSAMGAFGAPRARAARWSAFAAASFLIAYGLSIAVRNETRPPRLAIPDPLVARYVNLPQFRALDDAALDLAARTHCARIGVRLTSPPGLDDPWDYPLIWRAHTMGIEVRHVQGTEPWPCVLQSMTPPPGPWLWSGAGVAYVRPFTP